MGYEQRAISSRLTSIAHSSTTVDYYESQIRLADSLYKNYLPQYNFEEVKAAVEFFDSVQLSVISRQRWRLFNKKADNENILIAESRLLTAAKAHYYHAVGLTERDDIVGACEHYLRALEIMEDLMAKDKRLKAKGRKVIKTQGHKVTRSQSDCHSNSATLRPCDSTTVYSKTVDRCLLTVDNPEDYEKIRFLALTYTRLGRLFYNEGYCNLAILKYKKALKYYNIIDDTISISYTYKNIGNAYQLNGKSDSALYYYNKSLETSFI